MQARRVDIEGGNQYVIPGEGQEEASAGEAKAARGPDRRADITVSWRYSTPEALFQAQYERLARALTFLAGDPEVAEDALQEAFVRLCLNWGKISSYEDPVGWVRRVALNEVRHQRRSLRRRAALILKLEREPAKIRSRPEAGDPRLWQAVGRLPLKQRTALALFYVADLPVQEVAEAMRVSEGTVKRHLSRARDTLREAMEDGRS